MSLALELERGPAAPSVARRLVRERYADRIPADRLSDLCLAVSELVTNAVIHGRGAIRLEVRLDAARVRGEVIDDGDGFQHELRDHGPDHVGGRGLVVVAAVCDRWGVYSGSSHVWFELALRHDD